MAEHSPSAPQPPASPVVLGEDELEELYTLSTELLEAARSAQWGLVNTLIQRQEKLLKAGGGDPRLMPGPQGVTPTMSKRALAIQQNWSEVQVLLNTGRQGATKKLEILSRLKKIHKTYGANGPAMPRLHDRRY